MEAVERSNRDGGSRRFPLLPILLSLLLLALVLRTLDPTALASAVRSIDILPAVVAILLYLTILPMMTLRWRLLLDSYVSPPPSYRTTLEDNWSGMSIGWIAPSGLGWDAYRVVRMAKRIGDPARQVFVILYEKFLTLAICLCIIVVLLPIQPDGIESLSPLRIGPLGSAIAILALITIALLSRDRWSPWLLERINGFEARITSKWFSERFETGRVRPTPPRHVLLVAAAISIFPLLVLAIVDVMLFSALGHELAFHGALFVVATLYIVFALPISFGSLGVREVSYILLYTEFGLTAEQAIVVSVLNLAGILTNAAVGAILTRSSLASEVGEA